MLEREKLDAYWNENKRLTAIVLIIWALVSYGAALMVNMLNKISFMGFPFGYYMGAQGALAVFVILIFAYAYRMNKLDRKYGVGEEEE